MDDQVRDAIASGATQVLVVGSGLDTLASRLAAAHPDVAFVEIDHPSTMRVKREGLARLGSHAPNLHLVAADLARVPLGDSLASVPNAWKSGGRSAVVAEGVLMYLREREVVAFLDAARALTGPESRLVLTLVEAEPARWLRGALSMVGEQLRWGIAPEAVEAFLATHGFDVIEGSADLASTYLAGTELANAPLTRLEHVVAATRRA